MSDSPDSKSNESVRALLADKLELPDGSGFAATPAKISAKEMIALSEAYLPFLNAHRESSERKKTLARYEPFSL